jgi:DMSO/TMAO reductase YedYZ molybdopterin-dependent catalytic subunit
LATATQTSTESTPTVVAQTALTLEPLPTPPPPRRIARDKDGSLTAAGRPKGQLAPLVTPNNDFFVVTKNAVQDPIVDAATWRLVLEGEVNNPVQVDYRTLRALPSVDVTKTLECISNFTAACTMTSFGCDLLSTASWRGARLTDVLALAGGLKPTAVGLACLAADEFSAGLPMSVALDPEALIVYEMNGQPLPREHGFPVRMLVPGRYGMKNPKWLVAIRAMTREYAGYYEQRNWNKDGIVKTMSRIDTPAEGATLSPGEQRVAGIAYAGDRGISMVEFSTSSDSSEWQPARILEPMAGKDAMVRWEASFEVPPTGMVMLTVRATDGTGQLQTEEFQLPQPDGASGRDSITVVAA